MRYIYKTTDLKRYTFPTHINDLIFDRSEASSSEAFMVVLHEGQATPLHQHPDTEQIFYVLEGHGILTISGAEKNTGPLVPGDVVRVPPSTLHSIAADGGSLRYLSIDCFGSAQDRLESTWDEHVKAVCQERGWSYDEVAAEAGAAK